MNETEYKLLCTLAEILDITADCMDYIDDVSGQIYTLREKTSKTFYKIRDENSEAWESMQRAECKIIDKKLKGD